MLFRKAIVIALILSPLLILAQSETTTSVTTDTSYSKQWLEIDTLIVSKGLTRTALDKIKLLAQKAEKDGKSAQKLKCLIYRYSLEPDITDNDPNLYLTLIHAEINKSKNPAEKSILRVLLAHQLHNYFANNRWNLFNRKQTTGYKNTDITTWSINDFRTAINGQYLAALQPEKELRATTSNTFSAILIKGQRKEKQTIYDLILRKAIDYFKSEDTYADQPIQTFSLNNPALFDELDRFISRPIATADSSSSKWITLGLYQKLLEAHRKDADLQYLIEIELERLEWIYDESVLLDKEKYYQQALKKLIQQFNSNPTTAQAWYLLANLEADKAELNEGDISKDTVRATAFIKAEKIIQEGLARYKDIENDGTANLHNLLQEINRKEITANTELVNLPNKPFRALITYRNIDTIYTRIIRLGNGKDWKIRDTENYYAIPWAKIKQLPVLRTAVQQLPGTQDHHSHHTEIRIDALPEGNYALLSSEHPDFIDSIHKMHLQYFHVSNISYIVNGQDVFVLHRETGKPLSNVKITVHTKQYNYKTKNTDYKEITTGTTNQNGYYHLLQKSGGSYVFEFNWKNERLAIDDEEYIEPDYSTFPEYQNEKEFEERSKRVFYFTDRSIYRPGQTLYFKGIAVTRDYATKKSKVLTGIDKSWIYLFNVNNKKIDSVQVTPNEYGSFTGSFRLPQNTLTGNFSLRAQLFNQSSTFFRVEEYKRPTFSVSLEQPKNSYRLNDSIEIKGTATAFAGNKIDNANIQFQVQRRTRFYYPYYFRSPAPAGPTKEIANGTLTTDAEGKFVIRFKAMDDEGVSADQDPVYTFNINVSVTDGNGETRTASEDISIGLKSMRLSLTVPALTEADSLRSITVNSTNFNDEKIPATVTLKIHALDVPNRLIRARLWERPDQFTMSEQEFIRSFPYDEYNNETDPTSWKKKALVREGKMQTDSINEWLLNDKLTAGYYVVEASSIDKDGKTVSSSVYFQLIDRSKQLTGWTTYQMNYALKSTVEPGDTASFIHGTDAPSLYIIQKIERPDQPFTYQYNTREKGFSKLNFTVTEKDRGGLLITEAYVFQNRVYLQQMPIAVPWSNKNLKVTYNSYRNKLEPGSKEKWTIEVESPNKEQHAIELLTGMYDASLDQFNPHQFAIPYLWNNNSYYNKFRGSNDFRVAYGNGNEISLNYKPLSFLLFDQLAFEAEQLWDENLNRWATDPSYNLSARAKKQIADMLEFRARNTVYNKERRAMASKAMAGSPDGVTTVFAFTSAPSPVGGIADSTALNEAITVKVRGNTSSQYPGAIFIVDGKVVTDINSLNPDDILSINVIKGDEAVKLYGSSAREGAVIITSKKSTQTAPLKIRTDFNETAFFIPQFYADSSGKYSFSFTMPESLTQWKWMSLAHSKDLAFGAATTSIVTQKTLMVQANAPRFMREGDKMEFSAKVSNLSEKELSGQLTLELIDATTGTSVDGWFQNVFPAQYFTAAASQSTTIKFPIQIPFSYNKPLTWRLVAKANEYSDGEENTLPVLTNRQLVTESLPILITKDTTQSFRFGKLIQTTSQSLTHEALTISYTANPIWEAIRALPYLMEYPYECVEQTFNRYYANALSAYIINKDPKIKRVFEAWQKDTSALKSKLQLNESLKQIMLEETPWVFAAESEAQKQKNLASLFDVFKLNQQADQLVAKLQDMQLSNGSFSWFKGGYPDRYMTNYILTGLGKLKRLGALTPDIAIRLQPTIAKALTYLDEELIKDYEWWKKAKLDTTKTLISSYHIQHLYMRSFYQDNHPDKYYSAYKHFYDRGKYQIQKQSIYNRALLGLVYFRNNEKRYVNVNLIPAVYENAVLDTVKASIYWKDRSTYSWYQSPIEHQSTIIQFLHEVQQDQNALGGNERINRAKNWLLLNKQTNNWKTTTATAEACYTLVMTGSDLLRSEKMVTIQVGNNSYSNTTQEAGTGYFQQRIEGRLVKPEMGNIKVSVQTKGFTETKVQSPSWGSIYWQYFEDMDKITPSATPLSITKKLFTERNSNNGKVLEAVKENDVLKPGDKVVIRLEIRSDRDMEYLHLKDTRAATMEPANVLSGFKWQDGLGYYESTKDASTNFFIGQLKKGTYVFDYPVYITHTGVFSTGNASIQCMYAPEFTSNSGGMMIRVEE